jgi:cytochrome P450
MLSCVRQSSEISLILFIVFPQVVMEALRLYPLAVIERLCVKDYKIPGVDFVIPKGMLVQIARYSA